MLRMGLILLPAITPLVDAMPTQHPRCHLAVDRSEPAYTVFTCVPDAALAAAQRQWQDRSDRQVMPDADIASVIRREWLRQVKHDDYPQARVVERLPPMLAANPATPVGLCWNGGIAITYTDYRHAQRRFESWLQAPDTDVKQQPEPARDPLDPAHHLGSDVSH